MAAKMMQHLIEAEDFCRENNGNMFYVGFLRSGEKWFPLAIVSDPETVARLDSLYVSRSVRLMMDTVEKYAKQMTNIKETFVHYLMLEEIRNLIDQYGLRHVAVISEGEDLEGSCGCGCGCG